MDNAILSMLADGVTPAFIALCFLILLRWMMDHFSKREERYENFNGRVAEILQQVAQQLLALSDGQRTAQTQLSKVIDHHETDQKILSEVERLNAMIVETRAMVVEMRGLMTTRKVERS